MNLNKLDLSLEDVYKLAKLIATIQSTTASLNIHVITYSLVKTISQILIKMIKVLN